MFRLVLTNIFHRRLRSALTISGIAAAVAILLLIDQVSASYKALLFRELNTMGVHMMLVPLGCPYDAAARVLKGNTLETSLPEEAVATARGISEIEIAAPMLIAAVPRPDQGRTDMFVGIDGQSVALKSWWKAADGSVEFNSADSVILGADAAQIEMRQPGDSFFSPETGRTFKVAGVLQRSGMSDDSLFFVPLATAQEMFNSPNRITAVGIRLRDPATLTQVAARLQEIPGAQVVTQTEMMGTFLNILGTVRTLLQAIAVVALCASVAGLMNTLLMSVAERAYEFSLFRAIGASRAQLFAVVLTEAMVLTLSGVLIGLFACLLLGGSALQLFSDNLPFLDDTIIFARPISLVAALALGAAVALTASLFPTWRALRTEPAAVLKGAD